MKFFEYYSEEGENNSRNVIILMANIRLMVNIKSVRSILVECNHVLKFASILSTSESMDLLTACKIVYAKVLEGIWMLRL